MQTRKRYSKEFKQGAISLVLDQGKPSRGSPELGDQYQHAVSMGTGI